jgi:cell shape-determining protein MreD
MANTTIGFGGILLVLGVAGYAVTGAQSPTALIPAALGFLLVLLGWLARRPRMRMHAMHGAALLGVLGFAGSVRGIGQVARMLVGQTVQRPSAAIAQSIMAFVCLAFVGLTVRSFIAARLARRKS